MNQSTAGTEKWVGAMPRGGPRASWLDRRLQTDILEYTDRYDIPDSVKQKVITALDRIGTVSDEHEKNARTALQLVSDVPNPRILELGAGHGKLSAQILQLHSTATVTISDLDPVSVQNIANGPLGSHPRARTQVIDATQIDSPDDSYDLVILAQAFHHLPPAIAFRAIAEATRVGGQFLVIDLKRQKPIPLAINVVAAVLVSPLLLPFSAIRPVLHDGLISALRAYSHSAFIALGSSVDPDMRIKFLRPRARFLNPTIVTFSRRSHETDTQPRELA